MEELDRQYCNGSNCNFISVWVLARKVTLYELSCLNMKTSYGRMRAKICKNILTSLESLIRQHVQYNH